MITPKLTLAEFQALGALIEAGVQALNMKLAAAVAEYQAEQQAAGEQDGGHIDTDSIPTDSAPGLPEFAETHIDVSEEKA